MYKKFYLLMILVCLVSFYQADVQAQVLYSDQLNTVRLIDAEKNITGDAPLDQPANISREKIYNMLASLHFGRRLLILKDVEDIRLFDKHGLELLSPYLAQALKEARPDQMVQFVYVKKAPLWRVIRNDRLISGKLFVRQGELYIKFHKLYAKVFGDYQRAGKKDKAFQRAKDIRSSLESKPGQRTLDSKFIALKIDHDYLSDLKRLAAEEEAAKQEVKKADTIEGIPVPGSLPPAKTIDASAEQRLKTLKELRKKNLISEKEYQAKRKEILGEL